MRALNQILAAAVGIVGCWHSTPTAAAQADFAEDFENNGVAGAQGPSNLVSQGWIFRNQCVPVSGPAWYDGNGFGGEPFAGSGYLGTDALATDYLGGEFSVWAILPEIPGQQAGDEFSIWVLGGGSPTSDTWFEVRYAPSGTSTGSGPDDVGDFGELLFSADMPLSASGYQRVSATVPGSGRLAFRMRADYAMTFAGRGFYLSVDTLSVGPSPDDPCGVPVPDAGQTVTWAAADGPFHICQNLLIPASATVNVEPGTEIVFEGDSKLRVEGMFNAHGTEANPITINGSTSFSAGLEVALDGEADIAHANIDMRIFGGGEGAVLLVRDSSFGPNGRISGVRDLSVIERCDFDGGGAASLSSLVSGAVRLTDSSFVNGASAQLTGVTYVDGLMLTGSQLRFQGESVAHPVYVDNVSVSDYAAGAGISIQGPNYLFGPNVITQNNLYPLSIDGIGAGVFPGSILPTSGNTNNLIHVGSLLLGFERHWANTGLDYVVAGEFPANYGGSLIVGPGSTIRFAPESGAFLVLSADLVLQGTREQPIVLKSDVPFGRWFGLKWVDVFDARATHTIFDGGQITVQSDGGVMDLYSCTVQNSLEGTASVTGGIVSLHGSKIIDNNVGMVTTTSGRVEARGDVSPNIFDGNGTAIEYNNTGGTTPYLRYNWWGSPTGPTSPLNPAGTGEQVEGLHPASYTPFLDSPPAQDDDFPTVAMMPTYFTAQTGDKIILRWSSSDDHAVVAHRVEFADHDFPNEFTTVATLPGDARSYEFVTPLVEPNNLYTTPSAIRIVAIDSAGQETWDKSVLRIPYQEDWTVIEQSVDPIPGPVHPGDTIDICWSPGGSSTIYVLYDGYGLSGYQGGAGSCLPIGARLPYSSSDTARVLVLTTFGAGGRLHYSFGDYFSVRPDPRFGDAAPIVEVTSPAANQQYVGGGVIPVRWTASDDEALRSFRIQASYDGGRTWHFVAMELPSTARSFDWELPASTGISDVRVRVVALDQRFQDSSDTTGSFSILPGEGCPADFNSDGELNFFDVQEFLAAFSAADPSADFTGEGVFDFFDVQEFLAVFSAGCP